MTDKLPLKSLFSIILIIFSSHCMLAGWVITEESTDLYGNKAIQTTFIQDNLIRHETQQSIAIIDLEKKLITIVFAQFKLYWQGTAKELKESSLEALEKQMEQMLLSLPPSSRSEFDSIYSEVKNQIMDTTSDMLNRDVQVLTTEIEEEVFGYGCLKYNILIDSVLTESIWHTSEIQPYSDINLKDMISFMNQLSPGGGKGNVNQSEKYIDLMKSGIILKSEEFINDKSQYVTVVTNIRETRIVPDFFAPPVNYRPASFVDILNLMPVSDEDPFEW